MRDRQTEIETDKWQNKQKRKCYREEWRGRGGGGGGNREWETDKQR